MVYKNLMGSDPLTKFLRLEFLGAHQGGVGAVPGHELVVAAELDDAAVVDDGDAVRVFHGREPVCDDDGGATLGQLLEGCLDSGLRHAVERGGRFAYRGLTP